MASRGPALILAATVAFVTSSCAAPASPGQSPASPAPPASPRIEPAATPPAASAPAAPASPASPAAQAASASLRANVEAVDDSRSTRERAGCRVSLSIFGDDLDQVAAITDTRVDRAEDDLGHSLLEPASMTGPDHPGPLLFIRPGDPRPGLHTIVLLRNPARGATLIKTLDLTLQLYSPTADNAAIATIESPLPEPGTPIRNAALEAQGVELVQLTAEQERDVRPVGMMAGPASPEEQRRLEAVAAEVARRRALRESEAAAAARTPANTAALPPSGAPLPSPRPAAFEPPAPTPRLRSTTFRVTDPNHRLIALQWSDDSGRIIRPFMPYLSNTERVLRSFEPARPGWHLVAYLATDGAVQSRELHLENIALP